MSYHAHLSPETRFFALDAPFELESGARLANVEIAFRTWGELAPARDNAVLVCHALTGSADVDRWWPGVLGAGRALDPERDFVVAANVLGGCYGTTGPASPRPGSAELWGPDFPAITVRDQVRLQRRLLDRLSVERLALVVGGSLGGMQALEWAISEPARVEAAAVVSAPGRQGAWAIALSALGRRAIELDPEFRGGRYPSGSPPARGLALARSVAMASYRSPQGLGARFGRDREEAEFAVDRWLSWHGRELVDRFDANSYLALLAAMDTHDVARARGSWAAVLRAVEIPVLLVASSSDQLYPPEESLELATLLPNAEWVTIANPHGHDAFLIEQGVVDRALADFRRDLADRRSDSPAFAVGGGRR